MGTSAEEIIGAFASKPGQPIGVSIGGYVQPLQVDQRQVHTYPTYEALRAEVESVKPGADTVYRNAEGAWVRICTEYTGEQRRERQADGSTRLLAGKLFFERPVALDIETARATKADYFHRGKGWVRYGVKREWEEPENLGSQATQQPVWEDRGLDEESSPTVVIQQVSTVHPEVVQTPPEPAAARARGKE